MEEDFGFMFVKDTLYAVRMGKISQGQFMRYISY